jgi:hypothetical protein
VASPPAASDAATPRPRGVGARTADAARASTAVADAGDDGEREITGAGASSTSPWVAPVPDAADVTPAPRNALEEKDTIRNLTAPTGRGLGALVAGACVACAFVAVLAMVTARDGTVETARTGLTMPRAPAMQPPPELTETPPAPQPPPAAEPRPADGTAAAQPPPSSSPAATEEPTPPAPRAEPPPAASSDRWF